MAFDVAEAKVRVAEKIVRRLAAVFGVEDFGANRRDPNELRVSPVTHVCTTTPDGALHRTKNAIDVVRLGIEAGGARFRGVSRKVRNEETQSTNRKCEESSSIEHPRVRHGLIVSLRVQPCNGTGACLFIVACIVRVGGSWRRVVAADPHCQIKLLTCFAAVSVIGNDLDRVEPLMLLGRRPCHHAER